MINSALNIIPTTKRSKNVSCRILCRRTSKTERSTSATAPRAANAIDRPTRIFSPREAFATRRPRCRRKRSDARARKNAIPVTAEPAINSGFNMSAPMSEMYGTVQFSHIVS